MLSISIIIKIISISANSVKGKINLSKRTNCFEIFGYDFIIDENFQPFLLEINTNPGFEFSSPLIKMLLPRLIDDAFKLTIDRDFNSNGMLKENRESKIINRRHLESAICIKNHPLCRVFKKDEENTLEQFENSIKFIVMDKNELTENDFLEIHNNMFYTMPVEEVAYFIKYIPEIWGIKVNDF